MSDCEYCGLDCSAPHPCIFGMMEAELGAKTTEAKKAWDEACRSTLHPPHDEINSPSYYQMAGGWEVIDVIEVLELNFSLGNALKYIARAGKKGDAVADLQKAVRYLQREIARLSDD